MLMEKTNKKTGLLNANTLRLLAMIFMLIDHLWGTIVWGNLWMNCVGRLAFPIFAFLISEGFFHTHDLKAYMKRLFVFALLSEIPFDLMLNSRIIYPFDQNVLFTLLLGLWAISVLDKGRKDPSAKGRVLAIVKALGIWLLSVVMMVDYGPIGVPTVLIFYLFRDFKGARLCQLAGMVLLHVVLFNGQTLPLSLGAFHYDFPIQGFAVFSLLLIWLYNGKKGRSNRVMQYAAYAFYPVHALVLYLILYFG